MITKRSSLSAVALVVADSLARHGIRAVLTGGACAAVHAKGKVLSRDVDFVLTNDVPQSALDEAMGAVGFVRRRDRYVHRVSEIFVEFPRGPVAIGEDVRIVPVILRRNGLIALVLSPTDSCRDRLAAFYHWRDRSSLRAAVQIAKANRVSMQVIRRWSEREGAAVAFDEFRRLVAVS